MKRFLMAFLVASTMTVLALSVCGQTPADTARVKTRDQLGLLLDKVGPTIKVTFRRSDKQPFNYVGLLKDGLTNADSMEIVIGVTADQTIGFRIFPHYNGAYVNVDKAKNSAGLMRELLRLSDKIRIFSIGEWTKVAMSFPDTLLPSNPGFRMRQSRLYYGVSPTSTSLSAT